MSGLYQLVRIGASGEYRSIVKSRLCFIHLLAISANDDKMYSDRAALFQAVFPMSFLDKLSARLPLSKTDDSPEYFFALNIGLSDVTGAVWAVFKHKIDILGQAHHTYDGTEDLMEKANIVLDEAVGALDTDPEKILFGVPDSWTLEDNLKEPYLKLLRRMVKEYDLKPMAYVTTTHAISHLMQKEEGVPPTAILLGIGDFIEVTLIRGGKSIETRSLKRTENLFEDIEKILMQFTEIEVLPSKIMLYTNKPKENLIKMKDELMSYPWMSKLSFLHFPKIEILEAGIALHAIVLAGAVEIDPDVDWKHSLPVIKQSDHDQSMASKQEQLLADDKVEEKKESVKDSLEKDDSNMGFVVGDIAASKAPIKPSRLKMSRLKRAGERETPKNFVSEEFDEVEQDLLAEASFKDIDEHIPSSPNFTGSIGSSVGAANTAINGFSTNSIKQATDILKTPLHLLRQIGDVNPAIKKLVFIPLVIILVLAAYILIVKAKVILYIDPKILENQSQVIADPSVTSVDGDKKVIPATIVETTSTGTLQAPATGSKQIGNPARGQVVLLNKTDKTKTLAAGTVLIGPNSLKFTLDNSVSIASQSAVEDVGTTYGKATSSVTASVIGPDSNLPGGAKLSFASYPAEQVGAKVDTALSGGTSKTVTVVTSDDQKRLKDKLLDDLRQKAVDDLKSKMTNDYKIITEALAVEDARYSFSKQVNDQAQDFALNASVKFKGTSYSETDLRSMVAKLVHTNVPVGYELNLQDSETQSEVARVDKDGKLTFNARFRAKLLPILNNDDLKRQIRGKTVNQAVQQLKQLENVVSVDINFTPSIPFKIAFLPILNNNLSVIVAPK